MPSNHKVKWKPAEGVEASWDGYAVWVWHDTWKSEEGDIPRVTKCRPQIRERGYWLAPVILPAIPQG